MQKKTYSDYLDENRLDQAIDALREDLDQEPENSNSRFLLFELLALDQDFDGAEKELEKITEEEFQEPGEMFAGILRAEKKRLAFFQGRNEGPGFLCEPPAHTGLYIQSILELKDYPLDFSEKQPKEDPEEKSRDAVEEKHEKAARAVLEFEKIPAPRPGKINETEFQKLQDADSFFGPFLEAFIPGHYIWIPLEQIKAVEFFPPSGYPDMIWRPAMIDFKNEIPDAQVFIPALYPRGQSAGGHFKMGAMTGFHCLLPGGPQIGYGQRDFLFDDTLIGIRQVEKIVFED